MSKTKKRIVAVISAIVMLLGICPVTAFAESGVIYENGKFGYNGYYNVISRKDYVLVPGAAVEYEMVLNNDAGTRRQVLHVIEVDPSNPDVSIVPGYYQIDKDLENEANWSHKELTEMAKYYEDVLGYNVVGGMNTDLYYNTYSPRVLVYNGKSIGNFGENVATGGAVLNPTSSILYVFKDAEGNISCDVRAFNKTEFDAYLADGTLLHAVGVSFGMVVKDGALVKTTELRESSSDAARSMVGVKADGTLVICMNDGRGANNSEGLSGEFEEGETMLALGCQWAANCDGGGSSTFISKRVGEDELTMRSIPCDGSQRPTAHGVFVTSNVAPTGILDVVNIESDYDIFAPGVTYDFGAIAIDTHGYTMDMPADVTWALSDVSYGTVSNGRFVSSGVSGEVDVQVISGGKVVGTKTITVAHPEVFELSATSTVVPYSTADKVRTITIPIVSMTGEANVFVDPNVVNVTLSNDAAGTLNGFDFTATSDDSISGVDVTVTYGDIVLTYAIEFGKGSEVIWDFEDGDKGGFAGFEEAKAWSLANGVENTLVGDDPLAGQFNEYLSSTTRVVTEAQGGQVRNGEYALAWTLDNTDASFANWSYNVLFNIGDTVVLRDVANGKKAITLGMWLYVPENAFPSAGKGLAFQAQIYAPVEGGQSCKQAHFMFTSAATGNMTNLNSATNADIPESRWVYATIDLSSYDYISTSVADDTTNSRSPSFLRTYVKPDTADKVTFYIDDITLDYSSAVDDRVLPTITAPTYSTSDVAVSLENGAVVTGDKVAFSATVADNSKLDYTSGKIFVDGVEYPAAIGGNVLSSTGDITLGAGAHTVAFEVKDELGNPAKITRNFVIAGDAVVSLGGHNDSGLAPEAQSVYYVDINVADMASTDKLVASLKLNNSNTWETKGAFVADGFEATFDYNEVSELLTVTVDCVDATKASGNTLVSIPVRTWTFDRYSYVTETYFDPSTLGNKPVVDINCEVAYGTVNGVPFGGEINVDTALTTISSPYHIHDAELTVLNKEATTSENGYENRTYCETCQSVVDWGTILPKIVITHNYEIVDGRFVCQDEDCGEVLETGTGIFELNGNLYYSINSVLKTGWQDVDGKYCYAGADYILYTGTKTVGGITYEFDETGITNGAWVTEGGKLKYSYGPDFYPYGWQEIDGETYFFGTKFDGGYAYTGVRSSPVNPNSPAAGINWYEFAEDGKYIRTLTETGFYTDSYTGVSCYVVDGATQMTGLTKVDGDYYYFSTTDGTMAVNTTRQVAYNRIHESASDRFYETVTLTFGADGKVVPEDIPELRVQIPVIDKDLTVAESFLEGESKLLEVVASTTDSGTLTYQWYKDGVAIEGATANTFTVSETGLYKVIVTSTLNGATAEVESAVCAVTVLEVADAPVITEEPEDVTILETETATLEVVAVANGELTYQWYKDGVAIVGATEATYETAEAGEYYAVVTNTLNGTTAQTETVKVTVVVLDVAETPVITEEPEDATILETETATLEVVAVANGELTYQWYKDGVAIVGATDATYVTSEAGEYYAVVTNTLNGTTAQTETVKVTVVVLDVADAPVIDKDLPIATEIAEGESVLLEVSATANGELSYQWYKDGVAVDGATEASYEATEAGLYKVVVTNTLNGTTAQTESSVAAVTVKAPEGFNVTGTVKAFGDSSANVTIELVSEDTVVATTTVAGNSGTYTFEGVEAGSYVIKVSKSRHALREYAVEVTDADVTQDLLIWLYGDVTGDGVVNNTDVMQINRYNTNNTSVFNQTANSDYRFKVANVTAITGTDTAVNNTDVMQINRYNTNNTSVFDRLV